MKAPNGDPTKLTEKQWVQVRTKAFKNWFGDWEKTARIEKLLRSEAVEITGEEYKDKYELNRESAKAWIKDNLRGEYTIADTGERVSLTKVGANKVTSHSMGNDAHLKSIVAIPKLINNAIFIEEYSNEKASDKFDTYKYYVCGLKVGDVDYTVKMTIGVKQGKKYYDHALTEIEKGKLLDQINDQAVRMGFTTVGDAPLQPYASSIGKDSKLLSILQTNASKVVDENGEPMVVYHQTNSTIYKNVETGELWDDLDWQEQQEWGEREDFDDYWQEGDFYTFDNSNHGRRSIEMPAYFFSPTYDEYHEYGDRTIEAFLNIRNPKINPQIKDAGVTNTAGEDAMNKLIEQGYDGFIREEDGEIYEINAFNSNQERNREQRRV